MNRLSVYWLIELNKIDLTNQLVGKKYDCSRLTELGNMYRK